MSLDAMRWAFQQTGLRSPVKFVLVALADRANEDHECWPSREVIAADTCMNPETVSKATEELVRLGLLEKRRRFAGSVVFRLVGVESRHPSAGIPAKGKNPIEGKSRHPSAGIPAPNLSINLEENSKKPEKAYAFTGQTVKISHEDFLRLAEQYPHLDLPKELEQLDLELRGKRSWWNPMNAKLNYRNKNTAKAIPRGGTRGRSLAEDLTDRSWA